MRYPYEDPCAVAQVRWQQILRDYWPEVGAEEARAIDAAATKWLAGSARGE